jgi:nicotinate dehydrogenase subunit A
MAQVTLKVNGEQREVEVDDNSLLLFALRNQLELNGPKFGCGLAQCGACTVLVDGQPARACLTPVANVLDAEITTLEGLKDGDEPGPLQQAFIEEQAAQCGYCINGMIMTAQALLDQNPQPTDDDIKKALGGNLCRCGTHTRIVKAVKRAAGEGVTA